jgi:hypothetical protein
MDLDYSLTLSKKLTRLSFKHILFDVHYIQSVLDQQMLQVKLQVSCDFAMLKNYHK